MRLLEQVDADNAPTSGVESSHKSAMDTLVTTEWLNKNLEAPDLVILDCSVSMLPDPETGVRIESGKALHAQEHIPGAVHADLKGELCDLESPLDYMMPSPKQFGAVMGALGVGDDSRVVLYDRPQTTWASRVWWMLRWAGFDRAALLDGGFELWKAQERPISSEPVSPVAKTLTPKPRRELIADRNEVFAAMENDGVQLIDTLPTEMYNGAPSMYGRPGHIPTASNVSAMDFVDESGRYKSPGALAAMFEGKTGPRNIAYCGGGILASEAAFIMTRLGFEDVAVYTASLQEWVLDPANPMVTEG